MYSIQLNPLQKILIKHICQCCKSSSFKNILHITIYSYSLCYSEQRNFTSVSYTCIIYTFQQGCKFIFVFPYMLLHFYLVLSDVGSAEPKYF
jgi:hypothetical protein